MAKGAKELRKYKSAKGVSPNTQRIADKAVLRKNGVKKPGADNPKK